MTFDLIASALQLAALEAEHKSQSAAMQIRWQKIKDLRTQIANHKLRLHFGDPPQFSFKKIFTLNWSELEDVSGSGSQWERQIHAWLNKHPGIHSSGYNIETNQVSVKIRLSRKLALEHQLAILEIIPWLKPASRGYKEIIVSDQTCAQFGVLLLEIDDSRTTLAQMVHGQRHVLKDFDTTLQALQYILSYRTYD